MNRPILKFSRIVSGSHAPKVLPTSERLRNEIKNILLNKNRVRVSDIQIILKDILTSYDVTGFSVYSEIQDMLNEHELEINNGYLNNDSIISISH
jgi:hypothetical protein